MKKSLKRILIMCIVAALLTTPDATYAKTAFSNSYTITSGVVRENPTTVFKNPYCFYNAQGIEMWGEKTALVNLPMDGDAARDILVINNTDKDIQLFPNGNPILQGAMKKYTEEQYILFHPNPCIIELKPGESQRVIMTVGFGNNLRNLANNITKSTLTITQKFRVTSASGNVRESLDNIALKVSITCNAYTQKHLNTTKNKTATISGYVKDSKGKAIKDAQVTIKGGALDDFTVKTNGKGFYTAKVYANQNGYTGSWHEYVIKVEKSGYADQQTVVYPQSKKTTTKSFALKKASTKLKYTQTNKIDLGIEAYDFDASSNGDVIAFIPFHSGMKYSQKKNKMNLTVVSKKGKLLYQKKLPGETPYVDVATDGEYVTTVKEYEAEVNNGTAYSIPAIWDKSGNEVYSREYFPDNENFTWAGMSPDSDEHRIMCKCTKISPDNKYLYVGSCDGELWVIDWKTDTIVWSTFLNNQIRTFDFSKDGKTVYITSGDGYMYCYTTEGTFKWKTYIGSWGVSVAVSKKYVAVTTKSDVSGVRLIDAKTGVQKWYYEAPARGCGVVFSPDEKLIWWGNDTCSSYSAASSVVIDVATGKVKFALDRGAQMAEWTADGKYLAVKTASMLYVYDGKTGETLWSNKVVPGNGQNAFSISFTLYYSADGKYLMAVFNKDTSHRCWGQAYFFKKK